MVLCTTLTVTAAVPVVTLSDKTFCLATYAEFASCADRSLVDTPGDISFKVTAVVSVANAKFKLKVTYKKDGVLKEILTSLLTQNIGTTYHLLDSTTKWEVAAYTALTIVAQDIVAA